MDASVRGFQKTLSGLWLKDLKEGLSRCVFALNWMVPENGDDSMSGYLNTFYL